MFQIMSYRDWNPKITKKQADNRLKYKQKHEDFKLSWFERDHVRTCPKDVCKTCEPILAKYP